MDPKSLWEVVSGMKVGAAVQCWRGEGAPPPLRPSDACLIPSLLLLQAADVLQQATPLVVPPKLWTQLFQVRHPALGTPALPWAGTAGATIAASSRSDRPGKQSRAGSRQLDTTLPPVLRCLQGKQELGEADDPANSWSFGRDAEVFQYTFVGVHPTQSGARRLPRATNTILRGQVRAGCLVQPTTSCAARCAPAALPGYA
jgi:hypothetical protein